MEGQSPEAELNLNGRPLFRSFFLGGFECSTHRRPCGRRLDLIAATGHDRHAAADYARLKAHGIHTVREGLRWHLIETTPGRHDFASVLPTLRAARDAGMQVIWDLFHYGWPEDLDIFDPGFVRRFARMAGAFAGLLAGETDEVPWVAPVNEISFVAWAGGEVAELDPYARSRGRELKRQLVRASIAATEAVWAVLPSARVAQIDPVFHVVAHPDRPHEAPAAEAYRRAQFQAWDMLSGRIDPALGGHPKYLDVIGVNYYPWNQWVYNGPTSEGTTIGPDDPGHRPFRLILGEIAGRYGRPLFIAETGTEGEARRAGCGRWAARPAPRSCVACPSGGSACTRSSISPAGTMTATATTGSGTTPTRPASGPCTGPWPTSWGVRCAASVGWDAASAPMKFDQPARDPETTPPAPPASPPTSKAAAPLNTPSRSPTTRARRRPSSTTAPATRSRSMRWSESSSDSDNAFLTGRYLTSPRPAAGRIRPAPRSSTRMTGPPGPHRRGW